MSLDIPPHERLVRFPVNDIPHTQALSSTTFRIPPLDGSLTMPEIWDWHLEYSPEHPLFVYSDEDGNERIVKIREAVHGMHRAGWIIRSRLPESLVDIRPVIAILAATDTITYFLTEAGMMRANCIIFPISPRNSPAAVAHLLNQTHAQHVIVGSEPALQSLAEAAFEQLQNQELPIPDSSDIPCFEDLVKLPVEQDFEFLPQFKFGPEEIVAILHSSGSSAFPKPRPTWHARFLSLGLVSFFGAVNLTGLRFGFHSLPMFHGMGGMFMAWAGTCGVTLCTFGPKIPAVLPTAQNTLAAFVSAGCQMAMSVPSFVEAWAQNPEDVIAMKKISKGILFGGGPLDKHVGDALSKEGVVILNAYGCTETGAIAQIPPPPMGEDWEYLRFDTGNLKAHWVQQGDGTAELVVMPGHFITPTVLNTTVDGTPAYATSDLFVPHPIKPGLWRIFGRTDDQIMHSSGEKTNPGPLEAILNQDPNVSRALMFGRGQFNAGILIEPVARQSFDLSDTQKLADFRNNVWPSVEKMNAYAPQHSRIFKEMILVTSPSKPFTYTAKNTIRRQAIIKAYESEIEALYAAAAETAQAEDLSPPQSWDVASATAFVRLVVTRVVKGALTDEDDLFQKGCDSLKATWIRNSILHSLRQTTTINTRAIPSNFVYQHSSILTLAQYISSVAAPSAQANGLLHDDRQAQVSTMLDMVARYRQDFPTRVPSIPTPTKDTVLVTGTTGSLGCTLLAQLLQAPEVEHIYALNRLSEDGRTLLDRQRGRLAEWGIDPDITLSPKFTLLEADMSAERLGLTEDTYDKIRTSVTHVIHNAYRVNFNLSLLSFEPNVRTARHLMDMTLSSPHSTTPRLLFVSSIGVLGRQADLNEAPIKEGPIDPSFAVSNGYPESKWVIERLLSIAEEETSLRPITVRLGQVAGGLSGAWNRSDWFPALVKSSSHLKCLPVLEHAVSWIPAVAAAQALVEMRNSPYPVLHLAHPRPVSFSTIISSVAQALDLPLVPFADWLARLRTSGEELSAQSEVEMMKISPALRLLPFFSRADTRSGLRETMGLRGMDMSRALEVAQSLSENNLPQLNDTNVSGWLSYW
ncbi:putative NRPS-like protein biosynthetic cluster [Steccherinum ochraceum]|uniref:Putative NRPS-like protein biosynthetic cluster n=1 Tax=Steccherinum ochraceum TaxID=92696 RepID=A0A4R0RG27_9APHY|nr:putative NRPS-like protein biosynthetic cluster [Steccherinum ochraceum]